MKAKTLVLSALLGVLALGCQAGSGGAKDGMNLTEADSVPCICGQPAADIQGCHHSLCVSGLGNPNNPDCLCNGLAADTGDRTLTSTGDAMAGSRLLGEPQILYLSTGNTVRGVLESDDGLSIKLRGGDGQERMYSYDQLDPRSVYRLKRGRAAQDDGPAQIEVGNYARDVGYYAHARRHYNFAIRADASLADRVNGELAILRQRASKQQLDLASAAMAKGDAKGAEKHIAVVLKEFPDEAAAQEAAAMLGDIQTQEAGMTRSVPDTSGVVAEAFEKAQKFYDDAVERNRKGLLSTKNTSRAVSSFENAIKLAERSRREIDSVMKKNADDPTYQRVATDMENRAIDLIIDADLNMASIYMTRESYRDALERVNHAIAMDPNNAEARNMRARVEMAASGDDIGGWVVGRRGAVRVR